MAKETIMYIQPTRSCVTVNYILLIGKISVEICTGILLVLCKYIPVFNYTARDEGT
jgi:hypothetical protein